MYFGFFFFSHRQRCSECYGLLTQWTNIRSPQEKLHLRRCQSILWQQKKIWWFDLLFFFFLVLTYSILEIKAIVRIDVLRYFLAWSKHCQCKVRADYILPRQLRLDIIGFPCTLARRSVDSQISFHRKQKTEKQNYPLNGCNWGYKIVYMDPS